MLKNTAVFALAVLLPCVNAAAADISNCISSCEALRLREKQGCMSYYNEQNRYTACLSDADRNYQACTGRCYLG